jgi:hypothetical protein
LLLADSSLFSFCDTVAEVVDLLIRWADTRDDGFTVLRRVDVRLVVLGFEALRA